MNMETDIKVVEKIIRSKREEFIGRSEAIKKVKEKISKFSESPLKIKSILITGESGVGKELVAREIYKKGYWSKGPFVAVNCSAIPGELIESELFGHIKGSFTGAVRSKDGKFLLADKGVLFLDEIGDMGFDAQSKILRVLEERTICPVGGVKEIPIDVLVVAATNQDLEKMVEEKKFRADLFHRLKGLSINVPSLRERKSDILNLANYFLETLELVDSENNYSFTEEAKYKLGNYHYPGNVRELKNIIEEAIVLCHGNMVGVDDLQFQESFLEMDGKGERQVFLISDLLKKAFSSESTEKDRVNFLSKLSSEEIDIFHGLLFNKETIRLWRRATFLVLFPRFNWRQINLCKYLGISKMRINRYIKDTGVNHFSWPHHNGHEE